MKNLHPHQIGFDYFELLIQQPGKNIRLMSSIDFEKNIETFKSFQEFRFLKYYPKTYPSSTDFQIKIPV